MFTLIGVHQLQHIDRKDKGVDFVCMYVCVMDGCADRRIEKERHTRDAIQGC